MNEQYQKAVLQRLEKISEDAEHEINAEAALTPSHLSPFAECADSKLTEKKRRNYKRRLLEEAYSRQLAMMLADSIRYIEKKPNALHIHTTDNTKIVDTGDKVSIEGRNIDDEVSAVRMVLICVAKGWESCTFRGNDRFLRAAMAAALRSGLNVCPLDDHQAAIWNEVKHKQEVEHGLVTTEIQPLAIAHGVIPDKPEKLTGLAGFGRRLDAKRFVNIPPQSSIPKWKR